MDEPPVHYLTRHLVIACQPERKDLTGAPLNTVNKNAVTCPACADALDVPGAVITIRPLPPGG